MMLLGYLVVFVICCNISQRVISRNYYEPRKATHPAREYKNRKLTKKIFRSIRGGNVPVEDSISRTNELSKETILETSPNEIIRSEDTSTQPLLQWQDVVYGATYAHALSCDECLQSIRVNLDIGLSFEEVTSRQQVFGLNKLKDQPKDSILKQLLQQLDSRLVQVLFTVAMLSAVLASFERSLEAFVEPIVILAILIINAAVGVYQTASATDALDALRKLQAQTVRVLRNGEWFSDVPASSLVPGDIITLRVGDRVPADARILGIKSSSFCVDEASLTGESTVVMKSVETVDVSSSISGKLNMVFSGTIITSGMCIAVVTATGTFSEIGKIDAGVQAAKELHPKTPLEVQLDEFGQQLATIVSIVSLVVWLANVPRFGSSAFGSTIKGAIHYAKVAVALGVAAIPEGLPAVITLSLALGTRKLASKQVIVRKPPSVETLGCTTVICTDKTGTLTTGQMTVTKLMLFECLESSAELMQRSGVSMIVSTVDGVSYDPRGEIEGFDRIRPQETLINDIIAVSSLCNDASIAFKDGQFIRIGEPTEAAFKVFAEKVGRYKHEPSSLDAFWDGYVNDVCPTSRALDSLYERIALLEFNRDRKSMGVIVTPRNANPSYQSLDIDPSIEDVDIGSDGAAQPLQNTRLLVKGAAEMVLERCNRLKLTDGTIVPITEAMHDQLRTAIQTMSASPLRCLALAYKDASEFIENEITSPLATVTDSVSAGACDMLKDSKNFAVIESDMVLVAMVGIKDPARPEVKDSINKCRDAGIRVIMITGDSKETAVSIAKDVGIFDGSEDLSTTAFTGQEFFSLTHGQQIDLLRPINVSLANGPSHNNKVFCRTEPRDKQFLVGMLQNNLDEVVAMTGDGVNDAPALQQAAIGVAMGITGTDAAKSAADMILGNDNFASIVLAVEIGRSIYKNMQTFCCFLISSNIGEVILMAAAALLGFPEPLLPLHLLWINLLTDGPPATALGFNPADPMTMRQPPRPRHEPILSRWMLVRYLLTGTYVGFAAIASFVSWFKERGISIQLLRSWSSCEDVVSVFSGVPDDVLIDCGIFSRPLTLQRPQSMVLASLIMMEMFKALSAVSLDQSIFRVPPWKNRWLLLGIIVPIALHLLVMYTPLLSRIFSISRLTNSEWKTVLKYSAPILIVEEILKLVGRLIVHRNAQSSNPFK